MAAYGTMEKAVAGLKTGYDARIESWVAQESILFGMPVFGYVGDDRKAYQFKLDVAKLVFAADLITANSTIVTVNGVATTATVFATDHDTTMGIIVTKLNAMTGVEAVLDATDTNTRTILIRTKGANITVSAAVTLGETQTTASATYGSGQVLVGVAQFTQKEPVSAAAGAYYEQYDATNVLVSGSLYGVTQEAVEANAVPKIFNTSGANLGKFGGATGVSATGWTYLETVSAAGLAELKVAGPVRMTYADSF